MISMPGQTSRCAQHTLSNAKRSLTLVLLPIRQSGLQGRQRVLEKILHDRLGDIAVADGDHQLGLGVVAIICEEVLQGCPDLQRVALVMAIGVEEIDNVAGYS